MTADEREKLWDDLHVEAESERDRVIDVILDRIEDLEHDRDVAWNAYDSLSEIDTELIGKLRTKIGGGG